MEPTGIKFIVERKTDGLVTTWHDRFDRPAENILKDVMPDKDWQNGKVLEAYLEFDHKGHYCKIYLDAKKLTEVLKV